MWCRLLPGAISYHYRNYSGRSSRTGSGVEQINYARVLVSSGRTHSLWSVSLRVHSWVYWTNALGRRRGSRKRELSFHRKINTWGIIYWGILFCHNDGELFWVVFFRKDLCCSWPVIVSLVLEKVWIDQSQFWGQKPSLRTNLKEAMFHITLVFSTTITPEWIG